LDGALIVNKPAGLTSHDVVARLRRLSGERSIGHLGTLDPGATGVLPLLLGRLTRLAQYFQGREKEYRGEIRFGFATDTYDAAGQPATEAKAAPTPEAVAALLPHFRGHLHQTPPPYSAKKIGGVPAHKLARRGEAVALAAVEVELRTLEMLGMAGERMEFRAICSPGTYMRSLAHDLGVALGTGAHLTRLERVRVGEFELGASHTLEGLAELASAGKFAEALLPPQRLLPEFPAVVAPPEAAAKLLHGQSANLPEFSRARMVKVFTADERLLALGRRIAGSLFHPEAVFAG